MHAIVRTTAFATAVALASLCLGAGLAHAQPSAVSVEAPSARTTHQAARTCSAVASSARWTGHWITTRWSRMSVCGCEVGRSVVTRFDVEAGPIWNQAHARRMCPRICEAPRWTGAWTRATRRAESTCTLRYPGAIRGRVTVARVAPRPVRTPRVVRIPRVVRSPRVVRTPPRPAPRPAPRYVVR